ncbi:MAG: YeeE/YedE thiosulfate transporter family protein [Rhodoplanes sp.]
MSRSCRGFSSARSRGALLFGSSSWKASATAKSMRRYIVGAVLMGFGGKLAGGCAVGAGVSGGGFSRSPPG